MFSLCPHPDFAGTAVTGIAVEAQRLEAGGLALRYRVKGAIGDVLWPAPAEPGRSDGLWQHSCFEAFVRPAGSAGYQEVNVTTSHRWATYSFADYRSGMREVAAAGVGAIAWAASAGRAELAASVALGAMPDGDMLGEWHVGLSAVIEERSGARSYWALRHPSGRPDFHHADCFAAVLAAPTRA